MGQRNTNLEYNFCGMGIHNYYSHVFGYSRYGKAVEPYRGIPKMFLSDHVQKAWCGNPGHTTWRFVNNNHQAPDGTPAGGNAMAGDGSARWYRASEYRRYSCGAWPAVSSMWSQIHGYGLASPFGTGGHINISTPDGETDPGAAERLKMWGYIN